VNERPGHLPPAFFYAPQNILNPAFTSQKAVSNTCKNLILRCNLCLKNTFTAVKSKIKNQNAKPQIKIQKELFPSRKPADMP
jgi:hypothetical protein